MLKTALKKFKSEKGAAPLILLVVLLGILTFVLISNSFSFKDKIFSKLFGSKSSFAASGTNTSYNMGVLVIKYFPLTADGQNIDVNITGDVSDPYSTIKQKTTDITNSLLTDIPKATKYLGYRDPAAQPSLVYQIAETDEYTQAVPMLQDGSRKPNYNQIMQTHNICNLVDNQNVKEVWLWAYQGPTYPGSSAPYLAISESKMSGPFGDISNSNRENNMPVCSKTYRVYTFNYGRGTGEAIHSWGHQIEAEVSNVDSNLFRLWQGPNYPQSLGVTGRCGSVHNPPNARNEYDWANPTAQSSDCLDWTADSIGPMSQISCANWGCQNIDDSNNPQLNYIVWNWQNMPGRNNSKTYQGIQLRNWWDVHGDFDNLMANDKTLLIQQASPGPTTDVHITDSFDRADNTSNMGNTDTGQPWILAKGVWGITSNQAYSATACPAPGYALVESNTSVGDIQVTIPVNKQDMRLPFRYVDLNNFYWVEHKGGDVYNLNKIVNGVATSLGQIPGVVASDGDTIKISLVGSSIKIYVNGVLRMTTSDSSLFGTKHGIGNWCSGVLRFDNFSINYIAPTPSPTIIPTPTPPPPTPTPLPSLSPTPKPTPFPGIKAPTNLTVTLIRATEIDLKWVDTNTNETGFILQRSPHPTSGFKQLVKLGINATSYKDLSVAKSTQYYYRVKAVKNTNDSPFSNIVSAKTPAK